MAELLDLDVSHVSKISFMGIDLDLESLEYAKLYAEQKKVSHFCEFSHFDAWDLKIHSAFDLITSNGLSIYEIEDRRVVELYRIFFEALKPGGFLVTSFLTPPPNTSLKTEWICDAVNPHDALLQKIVFFDILDCRWQAYRSQEVVVSQLRLAGFQEIKILYDIAHIFGTVIAKKS